MLEIIMGKKRRIETFKEFHRLVPGIIRKILTNADLAIRALANPLLALEELGYELSETVQYEIERYLRYSTTNQKTLDDLEREITKLVGHSVDLRSEAEVAKTLFMELKLKKPASKVQIIPSIDVRTEGRKKISNPSHTQKISFEGLTNDHPVVGLVIKYNTIANAVPPFASRELYDELKSGKKRLPISKVTIRLKGEHADLEENDIA
jgi:DNA polymerase I-like protein with 3'-5' exonuclease and polymerase domains